MTLPTEARLVVVGAGLIGASLVAALRKAGFRWRFACVDRSAATRRRALDTGLFDEAAARYRKIPGPVDFALIAVPVLSFEEVLGDLAPALGERTVIFDCGSCKALAVRLAAEMLGAGARRFVPCHPIAGREFHGIGAAEADLFSGKSVIVTPAGSSPKARGPVCAIWRAAGARIRFMDAKQHDEIFAAVSHLPHALAFALVDMIGHDPLSRPMLENAASGFRDFTRIASSSPDMWRDILLANRENILGALAGYEDQLGKLRRALRDGDGDALLRHFKSARELRNRWIHQIER